MLYLVISSPQPAKPEDVKSARVQFRSWMNDLKSKNKVVCSYYRVGRGIVAILDLASNDELHGILTQWMGIVPVSFDIYPLASPSKAEELLK
jgi:hypothetical protein